MNEFYSHFVLYARIAQLSGYKGEFQMNLFSELLDLEVDSPEFLIIFKYISGLIYRYREDHDGVLPPDLWRELLTLAGSYPVVEALIVHDDKLYLKRRNDHKPPKGEMEWQGKLHVVGTVLLPHEAPLDGLVRLLKSEVFGLDFPTIQTEFFGSVRYEIPARKSVGDTVLIVVHIDNPNNLQQGFEVVHKGNLKEVLHMHQEIVEHFWVWDHLPRMLNYLK